MMETVKRELEAANAEKAEADKKKSKKYEETLIKQKELIKKTKEEKIRIPKKKT